MRKDWLKRLLAVVIITIMACHAVRPARAEAFTLSAAGIAIIGAVMVAGGMTFATTSAAENTARYAYSQDKPFWENIIRQGSQSPAAQAFATSYFMWNMAIAWVQAKFGVSNGNIAVGANGEGSFVGVDNSTINGMLKYMDELSTVYYPYYFIQVDRTYGKSEVQLVVSRYVTVVSDANGTAYRVGSESYLYKADGTRKVVVTFGEKTFIYTADSEYTLVHPKTSRADAQKLEEEYDGSAINYTYSGAHAASLANRLASDVTSDEDTIAIPQGYTNVSQVVGLTAAELPVVVNSTGTETWPGETDIDNPGTVNPPIDVPDVPATDVGIISGIVSGIQAKIDALYDWAVSFSTTIAGALEGVATDVKVGIGTAVDGISTSIDASTAAIQSSVATAANTIVGEGELNYDKLKINGMALASVFPFCIPFDFINTIKSLSVTARAPVFRMDFNGTMFGNYVWELNMAEYENIATIIRWAVWIGFFIGLMVNTRSFIRW